MISMSGISPIAASLNGLRQAEQSLEAAVEAVNSGSLDLDSMAKAAVLLQSADIQAGASAVTLRAGIDLQKHAIDILA